MRRTKAFMPTSKEAPSDAVLASHIYLSRAGFVSQVASGLYNYMPLALKVIKKIEKIIDEEMQKVDAQKVELSFVTPASLWKKSGRLEKFGSELLRFKDRKNNSFVLGPTHEEMIVDMVKDTITSYKQLPLNLYQIKTKFRDEARPRFGLMRAREFIMKDGYSFHSSTKDLDREFLTMENAYKNILNRLNLDFRVVEADSGLIGGADSKEFMLISDSGEDTIVICSSCEYSANIEAAQRFPRIFSKEKVKQEEIHTPNISSIKDLSVFVNTNPSNILKCVAKKAIFEDKEEIVLFFLRGDDMLQEVKALNATQSLELKDVNEEDLKSLGLVPGFIGLSELRDVKFFIDNDLKNAVNLTCGADKIDYHIQGFNFDGFDTFFDLAQLKDGDKCPKCKGDISLTKGIEVGHIFKLGDKYSASLNARYLDQDGKSQAFIMGTYGMGISRMLAGIVEQSHDENGCIWTKETAPYLVNIIISNVKNDEQKEVGEHIYKYLVDKNIETVLDDRKDRFGFKMKDAELIGFPYTIIVGKELLNDKVEIFSRVDKIKTQIDKSEILEKIMELVK